MSKNWQLLRQTRDYIATHPEDWYQGTWRCESGMCFAGWAATMSGGQWLDSDPESFRSMYMVAEPDDKGEEIHTFTDGKSGVMAGHRAARLLGLRNDHVYGPVESDDLFGAYNSLEDIDAILCKWAMEEDWSEAYEENERRDAEAMALVDAGV